MVARTMNKTKRTKTLSLDLQTVRVLDPRELRDAQGAGNTMGISGCRDCSGNRGCLPTAQ